MGADSQIDRIIPQGTAPVPPSAIFGAEPTHDWCYYYQKASLARQNGDWAGVGRLYDQTVALGLKARDSSEVFPFLEGLVNAGRLDDAQKLFETAIKPQPDLNYEICQALAKDPAYPPEFKYNYTALHQLLCAP